VAVTAQVWLIFQISGGKGQNPAQALQYLFVNIRRAFSLLLGLTLAAALIMVARTRPALSLPNQPPGPAADNEALPTPDLVESRQRGVALGLFAEDVSFSYEPLIREIAAAGASHISLIVPLYQTHGASTTLALHTRLSPTLEAVADAIRLARRAGLEVTLFPIIRLSQPRDPLEWRGTLKPESRDAWFASYGALLADLASLASLTGASRLVVGSELSTLDGDLKHWRPLLERVRALFPGTLMYSANWDHYQDARLFELVDELGVVAYFKLREPNQPSDVETLTQGWRRLRRELERNLDGYGKPWVLSELGYRSRVNATAAPWDEGSGGEPDAAEQLRAYQAFRAAWLGDDKGSSRMAGLYMWNWYGYGGPQTTSYTPRGKPAVDVVRQILEDL
jgi:hypothetical protein